MEPSRIHALRTLEVVAVGCHEHAQKRLQDQLASFKPPIRTFNLVEYFCESPVSFLRPDTWAETKVYFPFIRRVLTENQFVFLAEEDQFKLVPRTDSIEKTFEDPAGLLVSTDNALVGTRTFRKWYENAAIQHEIPPHLTCEQVSEEYPIKAFQPSEWGDYFLRVLSTGKDESQNLARAYGLVVQPYVASKQKTLMIGYPLASAALFYGYLMFIMPLEKQLCQPEVVLTLEREVWKLLSEEAKSRYVPVLALLHQSLLEEDLSKRIEAQNWKEQFRLFCEDRIVFLETSENCVTDHRKCPHVARPYSPRECALHTLWKKRQELVGAVRDDREGLAALRESLVFAKYNVSSPGMVDQLHKAMTNPLTLPDREGTPLPAALVYGGPGAGKDAMAKFIKLFSNGYTYASGLAVPIHTINMAAIRPSEITGPLLQGMSLVWKDAQKEAAAKEDHFGGFNLEGLLIQAKSREPHISVFVLDELNSLDVDLQGILLRIIENGEVSLLGSLQRDHVRHMIIGVVNEDPDDISRESEMKEVLIGKGKLGGILSALLYEVFRRTRRLREDLYRRLRRNLYLKLPELRDRPEDVPILFYSFLSREKGWEDVAVDFRAYQLLMDPRITWPGNVRQVQSVALRILQKKQFDLEPDSRKRVKYQDVAHVLNEEFPILDLVPRIKGCES